MPLLLFCRAVAAANVDEASCLVMKRQDAASTFATRAGGELGKPASRSPVECEMYRSKLMARWLFLSLILSLCLGLVCAQAGQSPAAESRFDRWDRNRDGKLTAEELPYPRLFQRADVNGDGEVTREEVAGIGRVLRRTDIEANNQRDDRAGFDGRIRRDGRYREAPHVESRFHSLDIYAPRDAKDLPVMVYVHGGGWRLGDKGRVGLKAKFFVESGFVFVSANYRLVPSGKHPNNVEDIAAALAWVHNHIADHGGNPKEIFLMGHSAGAHLVSLVATDHRRLEKLGKSLAIVRGVIANDSQAYDLVALMKSERRTALYRDVFGTDPKVQRDASPLHHVARNKHIPPFLILYSRGLSSFRVNPSRGTQSETFAAALSKAGVRAEVFDATDRNHGEINAWFGKPDDNVTRKAMEFIESLRTAEGSKKKDE